eukprot:TRINITY_DN3530_c0_g1_i1.p1 TRINITY_DN3530_c0_g1~~TRINITY_DN3530_c0_g1_i1.p1  ORF type:complete len:271 (-),score=47.09 TRINITY_DN3530_c0_g1_i1:72-884(-)
MALITFFIICFGAVAAVRTINEDEANGSGIEDSSAGDTARCISWYDTYTGIRSKLDLSAQKGEDITRTRNVMRLLRAARALQAASRANCGWVTRANSKGMDTQAPYLSATILKKLSELPCEMQAMNHWQQGRFLTAVDTYLAEEGECDVVVRDEAGFQDSEEHEDKIAHDAEELDLSLPNGGEEPLSNDSGKSLVTSLLESASSAEMWTGTAIVVVVFLCIFPPTAVLVIPVATIGLAVTMLMCVISPGVNKKGKPLTFKQCFLKYWDGW